MATDIREVLKELRASPSINRTPSSLQLQTASASPVASQSLASILEEIQRQQAELAPVWNVPYRRNLLFTGREDILQQLHEFFAQDKAASKQPLVLSGLGGVGKTQIALEYAYRYREDYHVILWAKADSEEVLTSELASFATLLNVPGQHEQDQQYALAAVKRWLEAHSEWLLILDNVEDLKTALEHLPATPQGNILLTTRSQVSAGIARRLDIDKLESDDGALLLLRRIGLLAANEMIDHTSGQFIQAVEIAIMLGGHPLAIDQAGAYLEENAANLSRYQELYRNKRAHLLKIRGSSITDHPESVGTTLTLHRLVQDVLKDGMDEATQRCWAERVIRAVNQAFPRVEFATWDICRQYLSQAQICSVLIEAWHFAFPEAARLLYETGRYLGERGQYTEAIPFITQSLTIRERVLGTEHLEVAESLHELAWLYEKQGTYAQGVPLLERALAIREKNLGPNHSDVARSLNYLGRLYHAQGDYTEAEPLLKRALTICEQTLGPTHPDTALGLNDVAELYDEQGNYTEAEPLLKRALAIYEQTFGPKHANLVTILTNYVFLLRATNRKGRAAEMEARLNILRRNIPKRAKRPTRQFKIIINEF